MTTLRGLACKHGVEGLIDWDDKDIDHGVRYLTKNWTVRDMEGNHEYGPDWKPVICNLDNVGDDAGTYSTEWAKTLFKLDEFAERLGEDDKDDIYAMNDVNGFVNRASILEKVKNSLYEGFRDFPPIKYTEKEILRSKRIFEEEMYRHDAEANGTAATGEPVTYESSYTKEEIARATLIMDSVDAKALIEVEEEEAAKDYEKWLAGMIESMKEKECESYDEEARWNAMIGTLQQKKEPAKPKEPVGVPTKTTAHIIDVDYEYMDDDGLNIMMYTRDVKGGATNLVMVPWHDYFYVELKGDVTEALVKKAVNGYVWYLENVRHPEAREKGPFGCGTFATDPRRHDSKIPVGTTLVTNFEVVTDLKSVYGYQPNAQRFLRITTAYPSVTRALFQGLGKKYDGTFKDDRNGVRKFFPEMHFYEAKTDVVNKFLTHHKLAGCVAVDIEGHLLPENKWSTCDNAIRATKGVSLNEDPDVPFYKARTMFFDIECLALDINTFPTSDCCPCIQISYLMMDGTEEIDKGVLCFKDTPGYESFEREDQMLIRFVQRMLKFNPDLLGSWNGDSFDMPYIIDRMKVLGVWKDFGGLMSRRKFHNVDYKRTTKHSKQFGTKEIVSYVIPGRVPFDMFAIVKGNAMIRLRSYSLKSVCEEFLPNGDNKEDLAYREIPTLFETPEGRARIASYCLQDTLLLGQLDGTMMLSASLMGQATVQKITMTTVLGRGLVHKIMCLLLTYTKKYGFLIPSFTKKQHPVSPTYQGATVLNCDAGYYEDPVCVLDFASLYPSLMRSYNLSYDTIAMDMEHVKANPDMYETYNGITFLKREHHYGLLPRLEADMAEERSSAKKKMKAATNPIEHATWNAIQGGVKIVMNSVYGLTGSPTATVPCVHIAATITYLGRYNLMRSKTFVEERYCEITGEPKENAAKVIYGDSVVADTPMFLQYKGALRVMNVRDVECEFGNGAWTRMRDGDDKESMELVEGLYTWTESGWTKMYRIIRHFCLKDVVMVNTHCGIVTCTVDHSLLLPNGEPVTPNEVVIGQTELMTAPPLREMGGVVRCKDIQLVLGRALVHESDIYPDVPTCASALDITENAVRNRIAKDRGIDWIPNEVTVSLTPDLCQCFGMFLGDGSCGVYDIKRGRKASWAINNSDYELLCRYKTLLDEAFSPMVQFKILDTMASSHVYKLVASAGQRSGIIIDFVEWWRDLLYYGNGEKKVPDLMYDMDKTSQLAFFKGVHESDGTKLSKLLEVTLKGKRVSHGITTLAYLAGFDHVVLKMRNDKPDIFTMSIRTDSQLRKPHGVVKKVVPCLHQGYVYDFTTENHHFQAGIGSLVVHNTDSIFILMPNIKVATAIKYGQLLDNKLKSDLFGDLECLVMEYEKVFCPYLQVTPKRYAGKKYEFDPNKGKVSVSGLQHVKRDSALMCKETMGEFFDLLLIEDDKDKALESVRTSMSNLFGDRMPLESFELTKKISRKAEDYDTTPPHIKAWQRMVDRVGVTESPAVGERFEYVILDHDKKTELSDAMVDSKLVREKGFETFTMDKLHYHRLYIYNPMHVILDLIYGAKVSAEVLDPRNYEIVKTVTAKAGNILGFFGVKSVTTKKRKRVSEDESNKKTKN